MAIRAATLADANAIAAIYAHHVVHGTATYDFDPPDGAYWTAKIADIVSKGWPFLVADDGDGVAGYAYATQIRDRPGYRYTCEDSIYVDPDRTEHGIGTKLLSALINACRTAGFGQMIAVIGGAEPASVAVHQKLGFREVGRLSNVGYKFDRYLDNVYMQRGLDNSD